MLNLEQRAVPLQPMNLQAMPLPEGDPGVALTVAHMRRLIDCGKKDPTVHETAAWILQQARVRAFDWLGEARAIYNWVLRNIRFTRDVYGKETLHAAADILRLRIGDCDDFTILMCSLLGTVGHKTRIVTVAGHPDDPAQFSHVFPEVLVNGRWIPMDAARKNPAFGRGPQHTFRRREWDTSSDEFVDVQGLNGPAGFTPAAQPRAYNPWVPDARFRALGAHGATRGAVGHGYTAHPPVDRVSRRSHGIRGLGTYGARAVRQVLGQDGFDWSTLPADIAASSQAAANIITASRANPLNLVPYTGAATGSPFGTPAWQAAGGAAGYPSANTLLWIGGGLLALIALSRGRY